MKTKLSVFRLTALAIGLVASTFCSQAWAQGTAFTYQGRLSDGASPANGTYQFQFSLFTVSNNGVSVAGPVTNTSAVINGVFTATLNFGAGIFTGPGYWLDISVRTNGAGGFVALAPRQPITPVPYAIMANSASNLLGVLPAAQVSAGTAGINISGSAASFTGSLAGNVTGLQSANVVSTVGGVTAANVALGANAANAATSVTSANTIVKRDVSGSFFATGLTLGGNLDLPDTTASAGIIYSGGVRLLHRYGFNNFFAGSSAGNFTVSGANNTGIGVNALLNNTSGDGNAALGFSALMNNTSGNFNIAIGLNSLISNTNGSHNTAIGLDALASNTSGNENTASGAYALQNNTLGLWNTATGVRALSFNTNGGNNTASGHHALERNKSGNDNTATGVGAMQNNTTGGANTATGVSALLANTTASYSSAHGQSALQNATTGGNNTAMGAFSLLNLTGGSGNIAMGVNAGTAIVSGNNNIDIGNTGFGDESGVIRIGTVGTHTKAVMNGIFGVTVGGGSPVMVNANGLLGTVTSSGRFKKNIQSMDDASDVLLALHPVTFQYKSELDPEGTPQFGLIAEEVAKVNPDLVVRDDKKQIYSVRYEAINAMLLNEFLKQHRKVGEQNAEIETLKGQTAKVLALEKQLHELQRLVKALAEKK